MTSIRFSTGAFHAARRIVPRPLGTTGNLSKAPMRVETVHDVEEQYLAGEWSREEAIAFLQNWFDCPLRVEAELIVDGWWKVIPWSLS